MVKKFCLASLGAWLIILPLTTAHGAMLEKYQILQQDQAYAQQYQANRIAPGVPAYVARTSSLYSDFTKEISGFSPQEKDELYRNFSKEQNEAIDSKEYDKAKYYGQLLGIILDEMRKGAQ